MPSYSELQQLAEELGEIGAPPIWTHQDRDGAEAWELESLLDAGQFPGCTVNGLMAVILRYINKDVVSIYFFLFLEEHPENVLFVQVLCNEVFFQALILDSAAIADDDVDDVKMAAAREKLFANLHQAPPRLLDHGGLVKHMRKRVVKQAEKYEVVQFDNLVREFNLGAMLGTDTDPYDTARRALMNVIKRLVGNPPE